MATGPITSPDLPPDPYAGAQGPVTSIPGQAGPVTSPDQVEPSDEAIIAALAETDDGGGSMVQAVAADAGRADSAAPDDPSLVEMGPPTAPLGRDGRAVSIGSSVATRGMTDAGIKRSGGVFGKWQERADQQNAAADQRLEADQAALGQTFDSRRLAMAKQARAESDHMNKLGEINGEMLRFQQMAHDAEALAQVKAKEESAAYIAAYKQDMTAVRALMAQSGNPLGGLSKTGGMALAAAAFAQGFLGARYGIKVDVSGQVDRWVEREMEQHQLAIKNQTNLAESNLTLYGLARQGAQDEWEGRQRLRGFVIDGLKAQVQQEASRYGAESAIADARLKIAELDAVQVTNDIALRDKVEKQNLERYQQAIDGAYKQSMASTESAKVSADIKLKRDIFNADRQDKADAKAKEVKAEPSGFVSDPFDVQYDKDGKAISGGKRKWRIDYSQPAAVVSATVGKVTEGKEAFLNLRQGTDELQRLYDKAQAEMKGPNAYRWRLGGEAYRAWAVERDRVVGTIRRAMTGLAGSKEEDARWERQLSDDNVLQSGDTRGLITSFSQYARRSYNNKMSSMVGIGLVAGDNGYDAPDPVADPGGAARDSINLSDAAPVKTAVDADVDAAVTLSASRGSTGDAVEGAARKVAGDAAFEAPGLWKDLWGSDAGATYTVGDKVLTDMVKGIVNPAEYRKYAKEAVPSDDEELRQQLFRGVTAVASDPKADRYLRTYATWAIDEIKNDPSSLMKGLGIGQN